MYDHFARWIKDGTPPPTARHLEQREAPPGEQGAGGAGRAGGAAGQRAGGRGGPPVRYVIARDELGNALGGIRLAEHAVPTATNTGQNSGGMFCGLLGSYEPFDNARLASLYPSHDAYVAKVREVTERNVKAGYILKPDAEATIAAARSSNVGKR